MFLGRFTFNLTIGSFHGIVNPGLEIVSDSLLYRLLFHLLAAIGAKLIGTYGSLQVVKNGRYWRNMAHVEPNYLTNRDFKFEP